MAAESIAAALRSPLTIIETTAEEAPALMAGCMLSSDGTRSFIHHVPASGYLIRWRVLIVRVLQALPTLGQGGTSAVVLNCCRQLQTHDRRMTWGFDFITHGEIGECHVDLVNSGSEIYHLKPVHVAGVRCYFAQLGAIRPRRYDVVHIHTGYVTGFYAESASCRGRATRQVSGSGGGASMPGFPG